MSIIRSVLLLPVYLFAISQLHNQVHWFKAIAAFFILHFFVYPSSNGYNSYMDRDDSPIGGLKKPLQPTRQLFVVSILMDVVAVVLSLYIHVIFALGILFYILASRAYSYRRIRLKQYPIIGFLTVFIFQGAAVFAEGAGEGQHRPARQQRSARRGQGRRRSISCSRSATTRRARSARCGRASR